MSIWISRRGDKDKKVKQGRRDEVTFRKIIERHGLDPRVKFMHTDSFFKEFGLNTQAAVQTPDLVLYAKIDGETRPLALIEVEVAKDYTNQVEFEITLDGLTSEYGSISSHYFVPRGEYFLTSGNHTGHMHLYLKKKKYFCVKETPDIRIELSPEKIFYARVSSTWSNLSLTRGDRYLSLIRDKDNLCVTHGKNPYVIISRKDSFYTYCPRRRMKNVVDMNRLVSSGYRDNCHPIWRNIIEYLSLECGIDLRNLNGDTSIYRDRVDYFSDLMCKISLDDVITKEVNGKVFPAWVREEWNEINRRMKTSKSKREDLARENRIFLKKNT